MESHNNADNYQASNVQLLFRQVCDKPSFISFTSERIDTLKIKSLHVYIVIAGNIQITWPLF